MHSNEWHSALGIFSFHPSTPLQDVFYPSIVVLIMALRDDLTYHHRPHQQPDHRFVSHWKYVSVVVLSKTKTSVFASCVNTASSWLSALLIKKRVAQIHALPLIQRTRLPIALPFAVIVKMTTKSVDSPSANSLHWKCQTRVSSNIIYQDQGKWIRYVHSMLVMGAPQEFPFAWLPREH